jgi:hypothetical protein
MSTTTTAVIVGVGSALCVALVCFVAIALQRHRRRRKAASFQPIDDASLLRPIRKRVVLMHSNLLYASDVPGSMVGSGVGGEKSKGTCYGNGVTSIRTPLLLSQIVPQVRIEPCCTRSRLSSELTSMSEYEIPLDKQWEFPREK